MDAQRIIDTAASATATVLGAGEAGTAYRDSLKTSINVDTYLSKGQRKEFEYWCDLPVLFRTKKVNGSDHPVLAALREVLRTLYARQAKVCERQTKTLVVGTGHREISMYNANPLVYYYSPGGGCEAKDYARIVEPALNKIMENIRRRTKQTNDKVFRVPGKTNPALEKRYNDVVSVMNDYQRLGKLPPRFLTKLEYGFETLVMEDSFYNLSEPDWIDLFERTGANICYLYGLLPLEMLYPDLPGNNLYRLRIHGGKYIFTYNYGHCNGYSHPVMSWSTLIRKPVMVGKTFSLVVEITDRVGPYVVATVTKTLVAEDIVRSVDLPRNRAFVRLLDVMASIDTFTGNIKFVKTYFSVYEEEYFELYEYAMGIDAKSLTLECLITFMRRRGGGASLDSHEILVPWQLPSSDYIRTAVAVLIQARVHRGQIGAKIDQLSEYGWFEKVCKIIKTCVSPLLLLAMPFYMLYKWLMHNGLLDEVVKFQTNAALQRARTVQHCDVDPSYVLAVDAPFNPKVKGFCPTCAEMSDKLGKQVLDCQYKESIVTLEMSDEDLQKVYMGVIDTDNDPAKLAEIKAEAQANMPRSAFKLDVKLTLIEGGPGTGKSDFLRKYLHGKKALLYSPFVELRKDYTDFETSWIPGAETEKASIPFLTTHRGMRAGGYSIIAVDEFTAMDWDWIQMVCYLNGAEELVLAGDPKQTHIREGVEGKDPCIHAPLEKASKHTLLRNFRNPKLVVALLNRWYGYNMQAMSDVVGNVTSYDPSESYDFASQMAFSHSTIAAMELPKRATVRANQGKTVDGDVCVYMRDSDTPLMTMAQMMIVAMSRGRADLVFHYQPEDITSHAIFENFLVADTLANLGKYLPAHSRKEVADDQTDPDVEMFLKEIEHSGYGDAFSFGAETLIGDTGSVTRTVDDVCKEFNVSIKDLAVKTFSGKVFDAEHAPEDVAAELESTIEEYWEDPELAPKLSAALKNGKPSMKNDLGVCSKWVELLGKVPEVNAGERSLHLCESPGKLVGTFVGYSNAVVDRVCVSLPSFEKNVELPGVTWYKADLLKDETLDKLEGWLNKAFGSVRKDIVVTADGALEDMTLTTRLFGRQLLVAVVASNGGVCVVKCKRYDSIAAGYITAIRPFVDYVRFVRLDSSNDFSREVFVVFKTRQFETTYAMVNKALRKASPYDPGFSRFFSVVNLSVLKSMEEVRNPRQAGALSIEFVAGPMTGVVVPAKDPVMENWVKDTLRFWSNSVSEGIRPMKEIPRMVIARGKNHQSSRDSHLIADTFVPNYVFTNTRAAVNELAAARVPGRIKSGKFNSELFFPVNARGHPKSLNVKFFSFGLGAGVHFSPNIPGTSLACLAARYMDGPKQKEFTHNSDLLAEEIVDLFFEEHCNDVPVDTQLESWIQHEMESAAASKAYGMQSQGYYDFESHVVRFHIKEIFKPMKEGKDPDPNKPAQGISAWSKDTNLTFGAVIRMINALFLACLKAHAIYDNRMTEQELRAKMSRAMKGVPYVAKKGIADGRMFDSLQDRFTQRLERKFLKKMNVSQAFIDSYYSHREKYRLLAQGISGTVEYKKTSGEPGTLFFNSALSGVLENYVLRGDGPCAIAMKGDDGLKVQCNLRVDQDRLDAIMVHSRMEIKAVIVDEAEFCGNVITSHGLIPSVPRKLNKVLSHRFRGYKHFAEYQVSLRDWLDKMNEDGLMNILAENCRLYGVGFQEMLSGFEVINSLGHIDEKEFFTMFKPRSYGTVITTRAGLYIEA